MWACDLFCDLDWVREREGRLGEPAFRLNGQSALLGAAIEILLFGDEKALRHIRFVLHTGDQALAQKCVNSNISTWVDSIEVGVILNTRRSFSIPKISGTTSFVTGFGQYDGGEHRALILTITSPELPLDLRAVGLSLTLWNERLRYHLFYYRRMIDLNMLLDQRWLYAYRLFEWHFAKSALGPGNYSRKVSLPAILEWRRFLETYRPALASFANKAKPHDAQLVGLLEQVRAMVAHAYLDEHGLERQGPNLITLTFPIMQEMARDLINSCLTPGTPARLTP